MKIDIEFLTSRLQGSTFISDVIYIPEAASTNEYAKQFKKDDNLLIITDKQLAGKGRYGRIWESEPGKNLTFTVKKFFNVKPEDVQSINFFFSNFTLEGIRQYLRDENIEIEDHELELKWPNDILLKKKKLSGFLIESDISEGMFIIGCGINVNQIGFHNDYNFKTTSLYNVFGRKFNNTSLLCRIIKTLDKNLYLISNHKFAEIFEAWKKNFNMIGKEFTFTDEKNLPGKAKIMGVRTDGGLQIFINKELKTIYSGDIRILYQN